MKRIKFCNVYYTKNCNKYFFNYEYSIYFFRNPYILEVSGLSKCGESHFVLFKLEKFHDTNKKVTNEWYWDWIVYVHSIWRKELKLCYILANDVVSSTVKEVGKQFQQAFMVENTRKEVFKKVGELENRVNGK